MDTTPELALSTDELLDDLDSDARWFRPRPFAVYGINNSDGAPFLGWGLDLPAPKTTVFYRPDNKIVWRSTSAEGTLRHHEMFSIARLVWLDD